jgi:hypothetical protein
LIRPRPIYRLARRPASDLRRLSRRRAQCRARPPIPFFFGSSAAARKVWRRPIGFDDRHFLAGTGI